MKNGIFGLASLDGSPLGGRERDAMVPGIPATAITDRDIMLSAVDPDAAAIDVVRRGSCVDMLLGVLDTHHDDARRLGLSATSGAAQVAAAARARWGADMPAELLGEWLFVQWDAAARALTLTMSTCARDDCYYAVSRNRVALAPRIAQLCRLDWIDGSFDGDALMRSMATPPLQTGKGRRTFVAGVHQLGAGDSVVITADRILASTSRVDPAPPPSGAGFDEALRSMENLLRQIVRQRIKGQDDVALLLSGGLDSSLLAWIAAQECEARQRLHFFSSASPPGSGVADETGWAAIVARHLGLPLTPVWPDETADIYAPQRAIMAASERPSLSPRHYLYAAFEEQARAVGARVVLDGAFGELTVSNHGFRLRSSRFRPQAAARRLLDRTRLFLRRGADPFGPFHVMPAATGLAAVRPLSQDGDDRRKVTPFLRAGDPLGFEPGWHKAGRGPTASSDPGVRYALPFRDPRLLRLAAALPASFAAYDGAPRAMVRAMLNGRLPDRISRRHSKMAFSPTWPHMLRSQAAAARARIPAQRDAGAGVWIDLDWLDRNLGDLMNGANASDDQLFVVQGSANAAHFLCWWQNEGRHDT